MNIRSLNLVIKQFAKYLVVGGLSNVLAYGLYLGVTSVGVSPVVGMSVIYVAASIASFTANRGWTFHSDGSLRGSALKYLLVQFLGYGTNLLILFCLYYILNIPHQSAQLIGIVIVSVELFLLNRYYVFS